MFGFETKWDYIAEMIGRKVFCDHVAASFWRGAAEINGFSDFLDRQRCIGNHHSHQFMLNYTEEFLENYKNHNKFAYIHQVIGHESTGSVLKALDSDLVAFLDYIMNYSLKNSEDLVLMFAADHGLHMGPWDRIEEGRIENLLPFSFILANKEYIAKLGPEAHNNLVHNTKRLTSKFDWHLTLKHIALTPYTKLPNSTIYSE